MRRSMFSNSAFSDTLSRLAVFIYTYPVFSFFVFVSVILMLVTLSLFFGAYNYKWEKRCAKLLTFSIVPVCAWMIYFYRPIFSPVHASLIVWLFFVMSFIINKIKHKVRKDKQQSKIKSWTCRNCHTFNEDLFLVCKQCNLPRKNKQTEKAK